MVALMRFGEQLWGQISLKLLRFDSNEQNIDFSDKFNYMYRKILVYLFCATLRSLTPTIQTRYFLLSKFLKNPRIKLNL